MQSLPSSVCGASAHFLAVALTTGVGAMLCGRRLLTQFATGTSKFRPLPPVAQPPTMWAGGVATDRIEVKANIPSQLKPRLLVSEIAGGPIDAVEPTAVRSGIASFHLAGQLAAMPPVQFRTFPKGAASFSSAFGSCARTGSGET